MTNGGPSIARWCTTGRFIPTMSCVWRRPRTVLAAVGVTKHGKRLLPSRTIILADFSAAWPRSARYSLCGRGCLRGVRVEVARVGAGDGRTALGQDVRKLLARVASFLWSADGAGCANFDVAEVDVVRLEVVSTKVSRWPRPTLAVMRCWVSIVADGGDQIPHRRRVPQAVAASVETPADPLGCR